VCSPVPALGGISGSVDYIENAAPVAPAISATVTFGSTIAFAVVTITNGHADTDVLQCTATATIDTYFTDQTLKLSGAADAAHYQAALRKVQFAVKGDMPLQKENRQATVSYRVCHSNAVCSPAVAMSVTVMPVNDRPVIHVSGSFTFTQGGVPIAIAPAAVLSDNDLDQLLTATVKVAQVHAGDALQFTAASGITGSYDEDQGELNLSGMASLAQYQTVLRSITFTNARSDISTADRTFMFELDDGAKKSASAPQVTVSICAPPGSYADAGTVVVTACPAGKYQALACKATCTSCAAGTFGDARSGLLLSSSANCHACPGGQYQSNAASTSCDSCPQGQFGKPGTAQGTALEHCFACTPGYVQATAGGTACTACIAGRYSPSSAGTACTACAAGQYQSANASSACTKCAAGKALASTGVTAEGSCAPCLAGSYSEVTGGRSCKPWTCCAPGTSNIGASATAAGTCHACTYGKYREARSCSAEACASWGMPCAPGRFMHDATATRAGECAACAPGSFKGTEDYAACTHCAAGKFGTSAGEVAESAACMACSTGQYTQHTGKSLCKSCAAGEYGDPTAGMDSPSHCKACTTAPWSAWSSCTKTCGGGTQTHTRHLVAPSAGSADAARMCKLSNQRACNTHPCPSRNHCHYLKCRYAKNEATQRFTLQVYHHHKEATNVHHCKIFEGANGHATCHCYCWYSDAHGQQDGRSVTATSR